LVFTVCVCVRCLPGCGKLGNVACSIIPAASCFCRVIDGFCSDYVMLQGLGGVPSDLLRIVNLIIVRVKLWLLGKTDRDRADIVNDGNGTCTRHPPAHTRMHASIMLDYTINIVNDGNGTCTRHPPCTHSFMLDHTMLACGCLLYHVVCLCGVPPGSLPLSPPIHDGVLGCMWSWLPVLDRPGSMSYSSVIPSALLILTISLTYSTLNPVICPFAAMYFFLGLVVYKYNWCAVTVLCELCELCVHGWSPAPWLPAPAQCLCTLPATPSWRALRTG
jgi:hypothetical protein